MRWSGLATKIPAALAKKIKRRGRPAAERGGSGRTRANTNAASPSVGLSDAEINQDRAHRGSQSRRQSTSMPIPVRSRWSHPSCDAIPALESLPVLHNFQFLAPESVSQQLKIRYLFNCCPTVKPFKIPKPQELINHHPLAHPKIPSSPPSLSLLHCQLPTAAYSSSSSASFPGLSPVIRILISLIPTPDSHHHTSLGSNHQHPPVIAVGLLPSQVNGINGVNGVNGKGIKSQVALESP